MLRFFDSPDQMLRPGGAANLDGRTMRARGAMSTYVRAMVRVAGRCTCTRPRGQSVVTARAPPPGSGTVLLPVIAQRHTPWKNSTQTHTHTSRKSTRALRRGPAPWCTHDGYIFVQPSRLTFLIHLLNLYSQVQDSTHTSQPPCPATNPTNLPTCRRTYTTHAISPQRPQDLAANKLIDAYAAVV